MTASISSRATFVALRRSRHRARSGPLAATWIPLDATTSLPGGAPPAVRVAYALPTALGTAVVRNRLRRRLRALVRELESDLTPGAYLLTARTEAIPLTSAQLRSHLSDVLTRAPRDRSPRDRSPRDRSRH